MNPSQMAPTPCGCQYPGLGPADLYGVQPPQNMSPYLLTMLRQMRLPGDVGGMVNRTTVYPGWAFWSASVAAATFATADTTLVDLRLVTNLDSAGLTQIGFTADNPQIAAVVDQVVLFMSAGPVAAPTGPEQLDIARSATFRVVGSQNVDERLELFSRHGSYADVVAADAAAAPVLRENHRAAWDPRMPPTLLQFQQDTTIAVQTRKAVTVANAVRLTVGLRGLWFKSTGGDIRSSDPCPGLTPAQMGIALGSMVFGSGSAGAPALPPPR